MQELAARSSGCRKPSSCCRSAKAARSGCASSRRATRFPSPAIPVSGRRSCSAHRCNWGDRARDRDEGIVPVEARPGRVGPHRVRPDDAARAHRRALRTSRSDAGGAGRHGVRASGGGLRQRRPARVREAAGEGGRRRAEARHGRVGRARPGRRARLRRRRDELEDADVLAARRRRRGRRHRLGSRPARLPSRSSRCRSMGRAAGDRARYGDRAAVGALRTRDRRGASIESVEVGGSAVVVARGEFRLP